MNEISRKSDYFKITLALHVVGRALAPGITIVMIIFLRRLLIWFPIYKGAGSAAMQDSDASPCTQHRQICIPMRHILTKTHRIYLQ